MDIDDIGKRLTLYRAERNLRQSDVATALGVTQQTIGNWEGGKPPRGGRLAQLERYLSGDSKPALPEMPHMITPTMDPMERAAYSDRITEQFFEALPDNLRQNKDAATRYAGVTFYADYHSANVCVELKTSTVHNISLERAVLTMAALRAMHTERQAACKHYALIIIGPHPQALAWQRIQVQAQLLGVSLFTASDPIAAAVITSDLEFGLAE